MFISTSSGLVMSPLLLVFVGLSGAWHQSHCYSRWCLNSIGCPEGDGWPQTACVSVKQEHNINAVPKSDPLRPPFHRGYPNFSRNLFHEFVFLAVPMANKSSLVLHSL